MKKFLMLVGFGLSLPLTTTFGSSWPEFSCPDKKLLMQLNLLDFNHCSRGQAKLVAHSAINISHYLCKGSCPNDWIWVGTSDNQCHDLNEFDFREYQIKYHFDEMGTNFSVVIAKYGSGESTGFVMRTRRDEYWHCTIWKQKMDSVVCANDV